LGRAAVALALAVALLAGAVVLAGALAPGVRTAGATGTGDDDRLITVTGTGELTLEPDLCRLTLGVQNEGSTAAGAEKANNEAVSVVIAKILALGLRRGDIKTVGFNLNPVYDYGKSPEGDRLTPIGFRCTHRLQVTVRSLEKVGTIIDQAVGAGGNTVDDICYTVEETAALREQALTKAVEQASSKAGAIATAINASVVGIKSIQESGVDFGYYRAPVAYEAAGAGAVPVMPGEVTIRASVTMVVRF